MLKYILPIIALAFASSVYAHCGSCGTGDAAHKHDDKPKAEGKACCAKDGDKKAACCTKEGAACCAKPEGDKAKAACCKDGEKCEKCAAKKGDEKKAEKADTGM